MNIQPRSVRFSPTLGRLDVAIQKPEGVNSIENLITVHMDGQTCKVCRMYTSMLTTPENLFEIPNCIDASITFDGYWLKRIDGKVEFYTSGLPYIAYVTTSKILYVQQYNGAPIQIAEDVSSVTIRRGWKALDNSVDQGVLVIYNKASGGIFYRSMQGASFKPEVAIEQLSGITNQFITCNLTTDYRAAIAVTPANKLVLTDRCWAGVSSPQEVFACESVFDAVVKSNKMPNILSIWNSDTRTIRIRTDINIMYTETSEVQFRVVDSRGVRYSPTRITTEGTDILIHCRDFTTAVGDLNIFYIGKAITNEIGNSIPAFDSQIKPVGTLPNTEPLALVSNIYNTKEV